MTTDLNSGSAREVALIDDVSHHEPSKVGFERAALPPAIFLAWCVSLDLASKEFLDSAGTVVTRLKMRDISPADAFVSTCGGQLSTRELSGSVAGFALDNYSAYLQQLHTALLDASDAELRGWAIYDEVSPWLTRLWYESRGGTSRETRGFVARVASWWSSR
ncbi:MAG: hypothetical protein NXH85_18310 [Pseudomonadaceae bacterium]|nr:hypothetical protein [Pseudomonadaceae bacterium]